jgi:hypothetical protein
MSVDRVSFIAGGRRLVRQERWDPAGMFQGTDKLCLLPFMRCGFVCWLDPSLWHLSSRLPQLLHGIVRNLL